VQDAVQVAIKVAGKYLAGEEKPADSLRTFKLL
jgi:hypothetical protein